MEPTTAEESQASSRARSAQARDIALVIQLRDAPDETVLNTVEAAHFLGFRPKTLRNWQYAGCGPAFHRLHNGAPRYLLGSLRAYLRQLQPGAGLRAA